MPEDQGSEVRSGEQRRTDENRRELHVEGGELTFGRAMRTVACIENGIAHDFIRCCRVAWIENLAEGRKSNFPIGLQDSASIPE